MSTLADRFDAVQLTTHLILDLKIWIWFLCWEEYAYSNLYWQYDAHPNLACFLLIFVIYSLRSANLYSHEMGPLNDLNQTCFIGKSSEVLLYS